MNAPAQNRKTGPQDSNYHVHKTQEYTTKILQIKGNLYFSVTLASWHAQHGLRQTKTLAGLGSHYRREKNDSCPVILFK